MYQSVNKPPEAQEKAQNIYLIMDQIMQSTSEWWIVWNIEVDKK